MSNTDPFLRQQDMPQSAYQQSAGYSYEQESAQQEQQQQYAGLAAYASPPVQLQQYAIASSPAQQRGQLHQDQPTYQEQQQYTLQHSRSRVACPLFGDSPNPPHFSFLSASGGGFPTSKRSIDDNKPVLDDDGRPIDPYQEALNKYGSPLAFSADWAPTAEEVNLLALPKLPFMMRVRKRFARTANDIFNPPAPSFVREPDPKYGYSPFALKISIPQESKELADGFKHLYPGRVLVDHDVSTADWARFLDDLAVAGRLTGAQGIISQVAPLTMHLGASGYFITKAIQRRMQKRKEPIISEAVETWNQYFFGNRALDVYLRHGHERTTARAPGEDVPIQESIKHHQASIEELSNREFHRSNSSGQSKGQGNDKVRKKDRKAKKDKENKKWSLVVEPLTS